MTGVGAGAGTGEDTVQGPDVGTALVTGASRGLGRGIAAALVGSGLHVVGLARGAEDLMRTADELGERFQPVVADAADPAVAIDLLALHRPDVLVLSAGVGAPLGAVQELSWRDFSRPWETDVRPVFEWLGAALRLPLDPGSTVVVISSGAALVGSPVSGGYAPAKAAARLLSSYGAEESRRLGLGLRFVTLLPQLTPYGAVGAAGAEAYARREGISVEAFLARFEPLLTPETMGRVVVEAVAAGAPHQELRVGGAGARTL